MSDYQGTPNFIHGNAPLTGVLLCNLGTPQAPTTSGVRKYLAEFLSDPRVVELPRALWLPLLHIVILTLRSPRSAHAYRKVWTPEGSPLLTGTAKLGAALEPVLQQAHGESVTVEIAMRYGQPSIPQAIDRLLARNVRRILVVPLYPQYASATTASVFDAVSRHCQTLRWVPELRFVSDYHQQPQYIRALADSVTAHWQQHGKPDRLLFSFHGIPHDTFIDGDPYFCQCQATARKVRESLAPEADDAQVVFQSRVGPKQWLEPYTDHAIISAAQNGAKTIDVLCPGFAVDCLETLEEIAMQYADLFVDNGGRELRYIPALNDSHGHIEALAAVVANHLAGWTDATGQLPTLSDGARQALRDRARDAGAEQ